MARHFRRGKNTVRDKNVRKQQPDVSWLLEPELPSYFPFLGVGFAIDPRPAPDEPFRTQVERNSASESWQLLFALAQHIRPEEFNNPNPTWNKIKPYLPVDREGKRILSPLEIYNQKLAKSEDYPLASSEMAIIQQNISMLCKLFKDAHVVDMCSGNPYKILYILKAMQALRMGPASLTLHDKMGESLVEGAKSIMTGTNFPHDKMMLVQGDLSEPHCWKLKRARIFLKQQVSGEDQSNADDDPPTPTVAAPEIQNTVRAPLLELERLENAPDSAEQFSGTKHIWKIPKIFTRNKDVLRSLGRSKKRTVVTIWGATANDFSEELFKSILESFHDNFDPASSDNPATHPILLISFDNTTDKKKVDRFYNNRWVKALFIISAATFHKIEQIKIDFSKIKTEVTTIPNYHDGSTTSQIRVTTPAATKQSHHEENRDMNSAARPTIDHVMNIRKQREELITKLIEKCGLEVVMRLADPTDESNLGVLVIKHKIYPLRRLGQQ